MPTLLFRWSVSGAAKEQLTELIAPLLVEQGFELADLIVAPFRNRATVRVFVYREGGVTLSHCSELSGFIGTAIEATDLFAAGYTLEVSSPGLDRPLTTIRDFRFRVGETVMLEFTDPARKKMQATIAGIIGEEVEFQGVDGPFRLPLGQIARARILL